MTGVDLTVSVRRRIEADPETLFDWWTRPEHLVRWWGPRPVVCDRAEVDLRIGGRYRLRNRLGDGTVLWIEGRFEQIERPRCLAYTWQTDRSAAVERVRVDFTQALNGSTLVTVTHERIADTATARSHEAGWAGCLDTLAATLGATVSLLPPGP
jgi:uncharacterized protein YndB with AHSA1/START domain